MRKQSLRPALLLVAMTYAGVATSAPLNWEGTLQLDFLGSGPMVFEGGGVATVNGPGGGVPAHLNALRLAASRGGISGVEMASIPGLATKAAGIRQIRVAPTMGTGTIEPISGGVASTIVLTKNVLPIRGILKLCLLSTLCTDLWVLPLTQQTPMSGVKGVGIGGSALTIPQTTALPFSIMVAPWTVKTASAMEITTTPMGATAVITQTAMGFAHDPASGTTSTAQPSGVLQLVTPLQIVSVIPPMKPLHANFGVLTVRFIPEPSMLVLLAPGVAGLAWLGRHRLRKSGPSQPASRSK